MQDDWANTPEGVAVNRERSYSDKLARELGEARARLRLLEADARALLYWQWFERGRADGDLNASYFDPAYAEAAERGWHDGHKARDDARALWAVRVLWAYARKRSQSEVNGRGEPMGADYSWSCDPVGGGFVVRWWNTCEYYGETRNMPGPVTCATEELACIAAATALVAADPTLEEGL